MMMITISHGAYADGTDRQTDGQTDGRQTVTLCFPLDAVSVMIKVNKITINIALCVIIQTTDTCIHSEAKL